MFEYKSIKNDKHVILNHNKIKNFANPEINLKPLDSINNSYEYIINLNYNIDNDFSGQYVHYPYKFIDDDIFDTKKYILYISTNNVENILLLDIDNKDNKLYLLNYTKIGKKLNFIFYLDNDKIYYYDNDKIKIAEKKDNINFEFNSEFIKITEKKYIKLLDIFNEKLKNIIDEDRLQKYINYYKFNKTYNISIIMKIINKLKLEYNHKLLNIKNKIEKFKKKYNEYIEHHNSKNFIKYDNDEDGKKIYNDYIIFLNEFKELCKKIDIFLYNCNEKSINSIYTNAIDKINRATTYAEKINITDENDINDIVYKFFDDDEKLNKYKLLNDFRKYTYEYDGYIKELTILIKNIYDYYSKLEELIKHESNNSNIKITTLKNKYNSIVYYYTEFINFLYNNIKNFENLLDLIHLNISNINTFEKKYSYEKGNEIMKNNDEILHKYNKYSKLNNNIEKYYKYINVLHKILIYIRENSNIKEEDIDNLNNKLIIHDKNIYQLYLNILSENKQNSKDINIYFETIKKVLLMIKKNGDQKTIIEILRNYINTDTNLDLDLDLDLEDLEVAILRLFELKMYELFPEDEINIKNKFKLLYYYDDSIYKKINAFLERFNSLSFNDKIAILEEKVYDGKKLSVDQYNHIKNISLDKEINVDKLLRDKLSNIERLKLRVKNT